MASNSNLGFASLTKDDSGWHNELIEIGYDTILPAPSSLTEGLLLDIASWFNIYSIAIKDVKRAISKIESLSQILPMLRKEDNKARIEWKENGPNLMRRFYKFYGLGYSQDPMLKQKKLPTFSYASSDSSPSSNILSSLIPDSLTEEEALVLATDFSIPEAVNERFANIYTDIFMPNRLLELMAIEPMHKIWAYGNMGLPAPIPMSLLLLLINEKDKEALNDALLSVAAENSNIFTNYVTMGCPFGMKVFDSHRFSSPYGIITTSKNVGNIRGRRDSTYISNVLNFHRPYLKCACEKHGKKESCKSNNIIWMDHALWFILHNFDEIFAGETLKQKMLLFFKWIQGAAQEALKGQFIFLYYRKLLKLAVTHIALQEDGPMFPTMENDMTKFIEKALAKDVIPDTQEATSNNPKRHKKKDTRGKFTGRGRGWQYRARPPAIKGGRGPHGHHGAATGRSTSLGSYVDASISMVPDSTKSTASTSVRNSSPGSKSMATHKHRGRMIKEHDMGNTIKNLLYD